MKTNIIPQARGSDIKVVVIKQFQEYLLWKPFIVKTNNNLLTYIMTTPNLDTTQNCRWSHLPDSLLALNTKREGDNAVADALSHVTLKLDAVTVKTILDGVTVGMTNRADVHHLLVADADEEIYKHVQETAILARAAQVCVDLHVTNWVTTQQEDSILKTVIE